MSGTLSFYLGKTLGGGGYIYFILFYFVSFMRNAVAGGAGAGAGAVGDGGMELLVLVRNSGQGRGWEGGGKG